MKYIYSILIFTTICNSAFCQDKSIKLKSISINKTIEFYTKPSRLNWHITSLESALKANLDSTSDITLVPKINFAQKIPIGEEYLKRIDIQTQLDAYMSISKKSSIYLMYAYSASNIFAKHLAAAEGTLNISNGLVICSGIKMYYWTKPIFSLSLGFDKYISKTLVMIKPYITYINSNCYGSINIGIRQYFKDQLDYIHLGIYGGHSAETIPHLDSESLLSNKTWGTYLLLQKKIFTVLTLKTVFSFRKEQYANGLNRNIPGLTIGISYLF